MDNSTPTFACREPEAADLNKMVESQIGAELPKAIASVKYQSADQFMHQLNKMPLFMTTLDETGEDDTGPNEALEAIQALQYEGEPWEVAQNFKEQGNKRFMNRVLADAREFYTRALAVKCGRDDIDVACLNNRAQCNLELRNYRKCITDCRTALAINPKIEKAWFRAAKAFLALDKIPEASHCIANALLIDSSHPQLQSLASAIGARQEQLSKTTAAREARENKKAYEAAALKVALRARNIVARKTATPPDMPGEMTVRFEKDADATSQLLFPVLLVYHLHLQTDLIAGMPESGSVAEQLGEVLGSPLDWDREGEYTLNTVQCYMETRKGGLIKVGKNLSLLEVLSGGKVEVIDNLVRIIVVPKTRNTEFVESWKRKMTIKN